MAIFIQTLKMFCGTKKLRDEWKAVVNQSCSAKEQSFGGEDDNMAFSTHKHKGT